MTIKVAINGYGTIGKRVAYAVSRQDDMKLAGVVKHSPDFEARMAVERGFDVYVSDSERIIKFEKAGIKVKGTKEDLFGKADVVVDATPEGIAEENKKKIYAPKKLNAIFEGGEEHSIAGTSFVAQANYAEALGQKYIRCVSCNTTGVVRILNALDKSFKVKRANVFLARRATDPHEIKKGPINAIVPDPVHVPSHHGPDAQTILKDMKISTMAIKVPTTLMHLHAFNVQVDKKVHAKDVIDALKQTPRVLLLHSEDGIHSTAGVTEYARELGRYRNDLYENAVWEDSIATDGNDIYLYQAIHQEADVVPENIDAIRAMFQLEKDAMKSIRKTDKSLGIKTP